jgi:hypothetical protein
MQTQTELERDRLVEQKVQKVKDLYADAPELGRVALEKGLPDLTREMAAATGRESAGRVGARQGKVSELTGILPIAEGGAKRLRGHFAKYQITAAGWYVANPDLTVVETRRLKRIGKAVDQFLDKISE